MKTLAIFLLFAAAASPAFAHRAEGFLQASLVGVSPSLIEVEVTLAPGIDTAPRFLSLLDTNGDRTVPTAESFAWAAKFMATQRVTLDGKPLPLTLLHVMAGPVDEMTTGHGGVLVRFTADPGTVTPGPHTIVCANHYAALPGTFQTNGLVPKIPGVRITSHRRDERQTELTLAAEFSPVPIVPASAAENHPPSSTPILAGLGCAVACVPPLLKRGRRRARP